MNHFFDIGSNDGCTFREFLCHDKKYDGWTVWCFEPSPRHLQKLMDTAKEFQNRYQIIICPLGITGETGMQEFYEKDDPRGDSFESHLASDHLTINLDNGYKIMAPTMSIWRIFGMIPPGDRVTLKIDAEGSEYSILDSMQTMDLSCVDEIFVEWHTIGSSHRDPQEIIRNFPMEIKQWLL